MQIALPNLGLSSPSGEDSGPVIPSLILLETGDALLLENGDNLIME